MAVTVKVVRARRGLSEQVYLVEIIKGLALTWRRMFVNLFTRRDTTTVQYPEEKADYPHRFRGLHRLMQREDGSVRCVACMMCSTVCPARCIHIVAGQRDEKSIEKFPLSFQIDELLCVDCGLCVEACPCDAIRMDTGIHPPPFTDRHAHLLGKADLLSMVAATSARSVAVQGGKGGAWRADPPDPRSPEEFKGGGWGGSDRTLPGTPKA